MNKYDELLDRAKMFYDQPMVGELMNAVRELKERPEIVRCGDCKWYEPTIYIPWNIEEHRWEREKTTHYPFGECHGQDFTFTEDGVLRVGENDFCSYGEKRKEYEKEDH